MSNSPDRTMVEQAIAWHLRLNDADEAAWTEFAEWLDADPAHNGAYEAIVDRDLNMLAVLEKASFPATIEPEPFVQDNSATDECDVQIKGKIGRRSYWRWSAIAASIAAVGLVAVQMLPNTNSHYAIETLPGESRTVALSDGSEIFLNGDTKIILDKGDARQAELAKGEARFDVKHDDADPFTVVVGKHSLVDIGTVFNVVRTDGHLSVGVVEGAVRFAGGARTVDLRAGDSLSADSSGNIELSKHPVTTIGSWADGVLIYEKAPLEQVASDLSRSIGISLELPQGLRSRAFSGVIQTSGDRDSVRSRLEELIGERIIVDGTHWSVAPR